MFIVTLVTEIIKTLDLNVPPVIWDIVMDYLYTIIIEHLIFKSPQLPTNFAPITDDEWDLYYELKRLPIEIKLGLPRETTQYPYIYEWDLIGIKSEYSKEIEKKIFNIKKYAQSSTVRITDRGNLTIHSNKKSTYLNISSSDMVKIINIIDGSNFSLCY